MSTSAEQVQRMLVEVPYLMTNPGIGVDEAAEAFGITPAQLGRDLQALWMCGLPGQGGGDLIEIDMDAVEDSGVIRLGNADYLSRPMRFTPDEATSLVLLLSAYGLTRECSISSPTVVHVQRSTPVAVRCTSVST